MALASANFTLTAGPTFPTGTSIGVYLRAAFPGPAPQLGQAPGGATLITSSEVQPSGYATFSGLEEATEYFAGGLVNGVWHWVRFRTAEVPGESAEKQRAEGEEGALQEQLSSLEVGQQGLQAIVAQILATLAGLGEGGGTPEGGKAKDTTRMAAWGENSGASITGTGWTSAPLLQPVGSTIQNPAAVYAAYNNTLALMQDGTLQGVGSCYGQLGLGEVVQKRSWVHASPGISTVKALAFNGSSALLLLANGTCRYQGGNSYGQGGNGEGTEAATESLASEQPWAGVLSPYEPRMRRATDTPGAKTGGGTPQNRPEAFEPLPPLQAVSAGTHFSLVLSTEGKLIAWGKNSTGSCGQGHTKGSRGRAGSVNAPYEYTNSTPPEPHGERFEYKEHGAGHAAGTGMFQVRKKVNRKPEERKWVQTVEYGTLTATLSTAATLTQLPVSALQFELQSGQEVALTDGTHTQAGWIVNGSYAKGYEGLVTVENSKGAGIKPTFAFPSGTTYVQSINYFSENEGGGGSEQQFPVFVKEGAVYKPTTDNTTRAIAIAAGYEHALAILANGEVVSWGSNNHGELGIGTKGTTAWATEPVAVKGLPTRAEWEANPGLRVVAVGASWHTSYAMTANGRVYAWGNNAEGQLGIGSSTAEYLEAAHVPFFDTHPATYIAPGRNNGFALSGGRAYVCGNNVNGQLANGEQQTTAALKQLGGAKSVEGTEEIVGGKKVMTGGNRLAFLSTNKEANQTFGGEANNIEVVLQQRSAATTGALWISQIAGETVTNLFVAGAITTTVKLASTLSTGAPITSLPVSPLTVALPARARIQLTSGANLQLFVVTEEALVGATSIAVESETPNFAYPSSSETRAETERSRQVFPVGSTITLTSAGHTQNFNVVSSKEGITEVSPVAANFSYPVGSTVSGSAVEGPLLVVTSQPVVAGVSKRRITVWLASTSSGVLASTATQVVAAITANTTAAKWVIAYVKNPGNIKTVVEGTGIMEPCSGSLTGGEGAPIRTPIEVPLPAECIGISGTEASCAALLRGTVTADLLASFTILSGSEAAITWDEPKAQTSAGWNLFVQRFVSGFEIAKWETEEKEGKLSKAERESKEKTKYAAVVYSVKSGGVKETCPQTFVLKGLAEQAPGEPAFYHVTIRNSDATNPWTDKTIFIGGQPEGLPEAPLP